VNARGKKKAGHKKAKSRKVRQASAPQADYPVEWLSPEERQRVFANRNPERPATAMDPIEAAIQARAGGIFA
jgi:hypothetical protein